MAPEHRVSVDHGDVERSRWIGGIGSEAEEGEEGPDGRRQDSVTEFSNGR